MGIKITRVAQTENSTLSLLHIDGKFECYLLEDKLRKVKLKKHTAIPSGKYKLKLNTDGGMNVRYKRRFPEMHKGMIEIDGIDNFDYVYIHLGNSINDTEGCPLTGSAVTIRGGEFFVTGSEAQYVKTYPKLLKLIEANDLDIEVENLIPVLK